MFFLIKTFLSFIFPFTFIKHFAREKLVQIDFMENLSIVLGPEKRDFLIEETLIDIFKFTAQLYPHKTALIFKEKTVTYQELDQWSDGFAAYLQKKGLKRSNTCIIWWPRGIELHVAILAVVKCGATYVPMDFEMPAERIISVIQDVKANMCITTHLLSKTCTIIGEVPFIKNNTGKYQPSGLQPDDNAYILFTSGSTGKPKGIPITHRNICHLVRAENDILNIRREDKVYQGFSVSFDMWCEETWISYLVGATLWIADSVTSKAMDELSDILLKEEITVLHAVPSLLAVMDNINLPKLRLINAGGEACTTQVLDKWADGNRHFYNSYGPTETTVTATFAELQRGQKITIGKPIANYALAIVNENMEPLLIGQQGELIITGAGVSNGYWNLEKLTREKFISKSTSLSIMPGNTIYRTGDAAYMNENKDVCFIGRIDDQVKLRGYRIELGEIETLLSSQAGVRQAAVTLKKDINEQDQLTAYVVLEKGIIFNETMLKEQLTIKLPVYMVPFSIVALDEMPRLPSGKIDRKKLPTPESYLVVPTLAENKIAENDTIEEKVKKILGATFAKPLSSVDIKQDFFNDLGGHSLLAASFVSRVRKDAKIANASLKDVYLHRPIDTLIRAWEADPEQVSDLKTVFNKIPRWRYYTCWLAQTIALFFIYGLFATQIFIPYLGYYYMQLKTENNIYALITALLIFCILPPIFTGVGILTKWLIIGKYKEGDYPLWGTYYFKWWLVKTVQKLVPIQFINGTPLFPVYLRLLGAKVAPDAQLGAFSIGAEDLLTIGNDVSISSSVNINNAVVENGVFKLSKVTIGNHGYVGSSAVVGGNTIIKDWGELQDLSYLRENSTIGFAEVWGGSPAMYAHTRSESECRQPLFITPTKRKTYSFIFLLSLILFPFLILIPLVPTIIILSELDSAAADYDFTYVWLTPILSIIYILLFACENIILSKWLQKDIKAGAYSLYSKFYFKKWLVDQMNSLSLIVLHPIYATVFISTYYRALGAKIGKRTEISTASSVTHPLLEIGNGSFIADAVTLGEADIRGQQLLLEKTSIDHNSFVGNSALIPQGYHLPSNMLIGVLSTPPSKEQLAQQQSQDWFGSPAIALPKRQNNNEFDTSLTFAPPKKLIIARTIVEFIRIILPQTIILICSVFFIAYGSDLLSGEPFWRILLNMPFYYLFMMGLPTFFVTVLLKWVIVGKYQPFKAPMWSWKVWSSELITSTYEALSVPFLLEYMIGTPWLPIMLKFLGVKTGQRIYMNTTDITEFDMVTIGDDVSMNEDCGPQTHLFEDRVMKVGSVKIGDRTTVGSRCIILYDSEIGNDVTLEPLSLVMKGETLPNNSKWVGSPVMQA